MTDASDSPDWLNEEIENFAEIAKFLNPSPGDYPQLEGADVSSFSIPLRGSIGGDLITYVDFNRRYDLEGRIRRAERAGKTSVAENLRLTRQRAGILVADVSGHRMTDAMIAAMLHQAFLLGVLYELNHQGEVTVRLFEHLNQRFYKTTAFHKYITMVYGEISEQGTFRFLNAGHHAPLVYSLEYQRFMPISSDRMVSFPPVGMLPSSQDPDTQRDPSLIAYKKQYEVNEIDLLSPGDILLLYSDGFSEHADGAFHPGVVKAVLDRSALAPAREIAGELKAALLETGEPEDDVSLVVVKKG